MDDFINKIKLELEEIVEEIASHKLEAPPPLQEGDWLENDGLGVLYVTSDPYIDETLDLQHGNVVVDVIDTTDFVERRRRVKYVKKAILTKDDLPDGWKYSVDIETDYYAEKDGVSMSAKSEHDVVAKALEHHLGQQLLKKAGG